MEGLGRIFNVVPTADGVELNLRDYGGVTFFCVGADTYTIQESTSAAGAGAQDLDSAGAHYFTNSGAVGATEWVEVTDETPDAAIVVAANAAVYVGADMLSAGFSYIECTSTAAGLVVAVLHELKQQRNPALLAAPAV